MGASTVNSPSIYACVCVKQFAAQALLRLRPELRSQPVAVMHGERPWESVCGYNRPAAVLGIQAGMTRTEAELLPGIQLLRKSEQEEKTTKSALLAYLSTLTPRIEEQSTKTECTFILDLLGTERLLGAPEAIATRIQYNASNLRLITYIAISHNFNASLCMARSAISRQIIVFKNIQTERNYLARLSLSTLSICEKHMDIFALWGLKTLGDLASLSETDLIVRLGQEGKRLRQLALGDGFHYFNSLNTSLLLQELIELDEPVSLLSQLLALVALMLNQLIVTAQFHSLTLAKVTIKLTLEDSPEHKRSIRPAIPSTDCKLLLKLIHLDLSLHAPGARILAVELSAEPAQATKIQLELFCPPIPRTLQLDIALARVAQVVGKERLGRTQILDGHESDNFITTTFDVDSTRKERNRPWSHSLTLRRLRPPQRISVEITKCNITAFYYKHICYKIEHFCGPWQSSGNWWLSSMWSTESWDIVGSEHNDARLICLISHDLLRDSWYMEALYD